MKRHIALVLALAFVLSFSGCNNAGNIKNETLDTPIDTTNPIEEQSIDPSIQDTDAPNSEQTNSVIVDDSLILVQSTDELTKPYQNFIWSMNWDGCGWLSADAMGVFYKLPDIHNEIPQINYGDDFEIHYREGVEFLYLSIYNSDFNRIHHNARQGILEALAEGTYYLVITVQSQGKYIETEEKYEYAGYECAYKIVIPDEISN